MIEVFTTNVDNTETANALISQLIETLPDHAFNFDLSDCDKILRAENRNGEVNTAIIIDLFRRQEFKIEILPGDFINIQIA